MKTTVIALSIILTTSTAYAWQYGQQNDNTNQQPNYNTYQTPMQQVQPNAYGPGVHMDNTGKAVTTQPAYGGNNTNDSYQNTTVKPDVYGPGIGMDQYGRPVTYK